MQRRQFLIPMSHNLIHVLSSLSLFHVFWCTEFMITTYFYTAINEEVSFFVYAVTTFLIIVKPTPPAKVIIDSGWN